MVDWGFAPIVCVQGTFDAFCAQFNKELPVSDVMGDLSWYLGCVFKRDEVKGVGKNDAHSVRRFAGRRF